jgi:hypothetical protein
MGFQRFMIEGEPGSVGAAASTVTMHPILAMEHCGEN